MVGINSFNGINPGAPNHVVFQFQNIPGTHRMEASNTNTNGYEGSEMKGYLMGNFLTGLKNATGLTDSTDDPTDPMLWGPTRQVANGGSGATGTDTVTDTLWLPTEWEMIGTQNYSSPTHEPGAGQARLGTTQQEVVEIRAAKNTTAAILPSGTG